LLYQFDLVFHPTSSIRDSSHQAKNLFLKKDCVNVESASHVTEATNSGMIHRENDTDVTITLLDPSGRPLRSEPITFFGSLGELSPASALTDANGQSKATFVAGNMPGQATLTVLSGYVSKSANAQIQAATAPPISTPTTPQPFSLFLPVASK
jgi:hypothetical protein